MRDTLAVLFGVAMLLCGTGCLACEPAEISAQLSRVKTLKSAGQHQQAIALANAVLQTYPGNPHASYAKGAAMLAQGSSSYHDGMTILISVADKLPDFDKLPDADKNCPENARLYTIFNTIGIYAFNAGDRQTAEKYLLRGLKNLGPLDQASKSKLYDNLGLFYAKGLNLTAASAYYQRAQAEGSSSAASRLSAIHGLNTLARSSVNP